MSIGLAGQWKHPRVLEAEKYVIETALKKGVAPRAEIGSPADAKKYLDRGVKHFCIGTDVSILFQWFRDNGRAMKELLNRDPNEYGAADFRGTCY